MTDHCIIKADFSATRTVAGRKVQQLIFEVAIEDADEALAKLGGFPHPGRSQPCAIALLDEKRLGQAGTHEKQVSTQGERESLDSVSTSQGHEVPGSSKKWSDYKPSQQAAILCEDMDFRNYLCVSNPEQAAVSLRSQFRIKSRSDLDLPENHARWQEFLALWNLHRQRLGK